MILSSRIPVKMNRVDFKPEEIRKFIFTKGLRLTWEQAAECPCKRGAVNDLLDSTSPLVDILVTNSTPNTTSEARTNCPACKGLGYLYHSSQQIVGIVTRSSEKPMPFQMYGEYAKGMVSFTTLPEHLPSYHDRFTLTDSVLVYRETRRRTSAAIESMKYPIVSRNLDLAGGATAVSALYAIKASSTGVVDSAAPLVNGVDFTITADGKIDWALGVAAGTAPAENSFFSISYYANPRYVVVDIPHAFRDTWIGTNVATPYFAPLPVNCMAQLEFLAGSV